MFRARAHLGLAAFWREAGEAQRVLQFLDEIPASNAEDAATLARTRGDAFALVGLFKQDAAAWQQAEANYRQALAHTPDVEKGRLLNNLGGALAELHRLRAQEIFLVRYRISLSAV